VQQQQADVLIHVQDSVARTVSVAANVTKRRQHFGDGLEVLEVKQGLAQRASLK
jgi:hypothetical protein